MSPLEQASSRIQAFRPAAQNLETMRMRPWPEGMRTSSVRRPMTLPAPGVGQAENRRNTAGQADAVISVALA